ncbi:hypothetical protein NQ117_01745 [Paenibacillus sp. SC116]|uniref:hypothetical protein n=1 Tax=Paenibacillus sp. SC116 TaxID=2968986 RepID=UPI00215AF3D2|nr:hypothetical protein [Paenibacillus sp. SC116]MCR8842397.1 hypothetical protein [Paenibacillus sp. SC116]
MKRFSIFATTILLFITVFSVNVTAKDLSIEKLKSMGFSDIEISGMDNIKRTVLLKIYDKYNGTAKVLSSEAQPSTLSGIDDINVTIIGGNTGNSCMNGFTCKGITVMGGVDKGPLEFDQIKQVASGTAWSDNWNAINYSAEVHYGDYWGNPVYKSMSLISAVPESGVSFAFSSVPSHINDIYTTVDVSLRRASGDTGTTDAVGVVGYTGKSMQISASVGYPPSVTFTPSTDIYQKSHLTSFYY